MSLREETRNLILKEIEVLKSNNELKLPTEKEMTEKFNISRVTLRSALADLEREGKIIRLQGKGTFINSNFQNIQLDLFRMGTYSQLIKSNGYELKINSLSAYIIDTPEFILNSGKYSKDKILMTARMFFANNVFSVLCIDYLSIDYKSDVEKLSEYKDSIFKFLYENYGIELQTGSMEFHAVTSDEIKHIDIDCEMLPKKLLLINGIEYDKNSRLVMFTSEYINTDIIKIATIRRRDIDYSKYKRKDED